MATAKRKAAKPAVEEIVEEDFELDADEAVEVEEAPKAKKAAAPKIEFGTKELAAHVNAETGSSYDAYNLRILLRKLTKDGVLERTESEGRSRYSFTGPDDAQVIAIVEAVKSGAAEKAKEERLEKLKADRKEKKPATKKAAGKKAKAAEVEPEAEEEDDFDVEEL